MDLFSQFEAAAIANPARPSLTFEGTTTTYFELHRAVSVLAARIRSSNFEVGTTVALVLDRSPEFVISVLAVLKCGGIVAPLDPSHPRSYLADHIDRLAPSIILQRTGHDLADEVERMPVDAQHLLEAQPDPAVEPAVVTDLDRPAYVIFTSGTTGTPKGVVGTQRPIVSFLDWYREEFPDAGTSFALCSGLGADPIFRDMFAPLSQGAALHIPPSSFPHAPDLVDWLREREVTAMHLTPQLGHVILAACESRRTTLPSLRYLLVGGDVLTPTLVEGLQDCCPGASLVNCYGTSETPQLVAYYRVPRPFSGDVVPIGRPLPDYRIELIPRPNTDHGEIRVRSTLLTTQSLSEFRNSRPAQDVSTATSGDEEVRTHDTGDLARAGEDGLLFFLGRNDDQKKVRGNRVSLEFLRRVLTSHPGVASAFVRWVEHDGRGSLVAYFQGKRDTPPSEIKEFLEERIPSQLLPQAFIEVDSFPLNANGKIDVGSLPLPTARETPREGPRNRLEEDLLDLWQSALNDTSLGVHDDFFERGGDSLSGMKLVTAIQAKLGEIFHILTLLEAPTVSAFAREAIRTHPSALSSRYPELEIQVSGHSPITEEKIDRFRDLAELRPARHSSVARPEFPPTATFILGAPRSGTTLLRVILGGHPDLFAPPALYLLQFTTFGERAEVFAGNHAFWKEGAASALQELTGVSLEEAESELRGLESDDADVIGFYSTLNERAGGRHPIDKTANYSISLELLQKIERVFDRPRYIFLTRHPGAAIHSFEKANLDELFYSRLPHLRDVRHKPFTARELAELVYIQSYRNIRSFFQQVSPTRRCTIRYEDLVTVPEGVVHELCDFLECEFDRSMLNVYDGSARRMTGGIPGSIMTGDPKFHQHQSINSTRIDAWREHVPEREISPYAWEVAEPLGYAPTSREDADSAAVAPRPVRRLIILGDSGQEEVASLLARELGFTIGTRAELASETTQSVIYAEPTTPDGLDDLARLHRGSSEWFFIHLLRHPAAAIREQMARSGSLSFKQAESRWTNAHRRISDFLLGVPDDRQYVLSVEMMIADHPRCVARVHSLISDEQFPLRRGVPDRSAFPLTFEHAHHWIGRVDPGGFDPETWNLASRLQSSLRLHNQLADRNHPPNSAASIRRVHKRIATLVGKWEGERTHRRSMVVGRNTTGRQPPLFWCFQHEAEFVALAEALGPDQPLFAMRSGVGVMEKTEQQEKALAARYIADIRAVLPDGPFRIGGNCQAARIAFEMATGLRGGGWSVEKLFLMEKMIDRHYPAEVHLLFGSESPLHNPYFSHHMPELVWEAAYGSYSIDIIAGGHGTYFEDQNLKVLAETIRRRLLDSPTSP